MDVWYCRADEPLAPDVVDRCRALLAPDELRQVERFFRPEHRRLALMARVLMRRVLADYAGVDPRRLAFATGPHGKPYLAWPAECGWSFNLSHTDGLVVLAVSPHGRVGVDVEPAARKVNIELAERYFAPPECQALAELPGGEQQAVFLRYWTLKEAFIKALGTGLATPLSHFAFRLADPSPPEIQFLEASLGCQQGWRFTQLLHEERYWIAVAQHDEHAPPEALTCRLRPFRPD